MTARILSWFVFVVLMTCNIAASLVVVVCLYLPWVAIKAVWQTLRGKARVRLPRGGDEEPTFHIG